VPKNFVHHRKFYDIVKTHSLLSLHSILSDMNKLKFKTLVMLQSKTSEWCKDWHDMKLDFEVKGTQKA